MRAGDSADGGHAQKGYTADSLCNGGLNMPVGRRPVAMANEGQGGCLFIAKGGG